MRRTAIRQYHVRIFLPPTLSLAYPHPYPINSARHRLDHGECVAGVHSAPTTTMHPFRVVAVVHLWQGVRSRRGHQVHPLSRGPGFEAQYPGIRMQYEPLQRLELIVCNNYTLYNVQCSHIPPHILPHLPSHLLLTFSHTFSPPTSPQTSPPTSPPLTSFSTHLLPHLPSHFPTHLLPHRPLSSSHSSPLSSPSNSPPSSPPTSLPFSHHLIYNLDSPPPKQTLSRIPNGPSAPRNAAEELEACRQRLAESSRLVPLPATPIVVSHVSCSTV